MNTLRSIGCLLIAGALLGSGALSAQETLMEGDLANVASFEHLTNGAGDPGALEMGYGGLELGYVHRPDELVHFSLGVLIGAGGVVWNPDGQSGSQVDDAFFVAEPELDVVLNVTRFFRVALGASYRLTQGVKLFDLRDADLSGLAGLVALKFGSF